MPQEYFKMKLQVFLHIKALFNTFGLSYIYVLGTLKSVHYFKKNWMFSFQEAHNSKGNNLIKLCKNVFSVIILSFI